MKLINFQAIMFAVSLVIMVVIKLGSSNVLLGWGPDNIKPGICPESDSNFYCSDSLQDECLQDEDCDANKKCCFQENCGHLCLDPVIITKKVRKETCDADIVSTTPGYCPKPSSMECIWCNDNCVSDCDCEGEQEKCCPQPGCGNVCRVATDVDPNDTGAGWRSTGFN